MIIPKMSYKYSLNTLEKAQALRIKYKKKLWKWIYIIALEVFFIICALINILYKFYIVGWTPEVILLIATGFFVIYMSFLLVQDLAIIFWYKRELLENKILIQEIYKTLKKIRGLNKEIERYNKIKGRKHHL